MKEAVRAEKTIPMQWVIQKKNKYEWVTVIVAAVIGFGLVFALIAFAELASIAHK